MIMLEVEFYVCEVMVEMEKVGFLVDFDVCNEKINYKVCEYLVGKVLVIVVVGKKEVEDCVVFLCCLG